MLNSNLISKIGAPPGASPRQPVIWRCGGAVEIDAGGPTKSFSPPPHDFTDCNIFELFQDVASRFPGNTAVVDHCTTLTYSELKEIAEAVAVGLQQNSLRQCAVGILMPHSASFVAAILGCLAAGRPYIALDQRYPSNRNLEIIAQAGLDVILVDNDAHKSSVPLPDTVQIITIQSLISLETTRSRAIYNASAFAVDEPAIILYTSGSSGKPKGIVNSQRSLLQRVFQYWCSCHFGPTDAFLPLSSLCTIAGTREAFTALLSGAKLCLFDPERQGLRAIRNALREEQVTALYSVPSLIRSIIELDKRSDDFQSLNIVRLGGDKILWTDIDLLQGTLPVHTQIQIGYSSTETTGTQWFVPRDFPRSGPCAPIGYVLAGIDFNLGEESTDAGGTVGELIIRSPYVALGQWDNGKRVAGAMSHDPNEPRKRTLLTGDLVRQRSDGMLELISRIDRQVKINGTRIEPAELETLLRNNKHVDDAVVIARRALDDVALVAFVASETGPNDLCDLLRNEIRTSLPAPLHPKRIHRLAAIPRLPSSKLDISALEREDDARQKSTELTFVARETTSSNNEIEDHVSRVWRNILRLQNLTDDITWDEAGGDSLRLLRAVFELEELIKRPLSLERFRLNMTRGEFSAAITASPPPPKNDAYHRVFLLPGLTGDTPGLASMRAELEETIQFRTISYPCWERMIDEFATIESYADAAVAQIVREAPSGDLALAGYSFGGVVAYEAAVRLVRMNRNVTSLTILDTNISVQPSVRRDLLIAVRRTALAGRALLVDRQLLRQRAFEFVGQFLTRSKRMMLLRAIAKLGLGSLSLGIRFSLQQELMEALQRRAFAEWLSSQPMATILPFEIHLLRSDEPRPFAAPDLGWGSRSYGVKIHPVPGDHLEMLRAPHRREVCNQLLLAIN